MTATPTVEHIPWQRAVYFRRSPHEDFAFSHVEHTTVDKAFPRSLSVNDVAEQRNTNSRNMKVFKQEPVLILVTGDWAEQYALYHLEIIEATDRAHRLGALCNTVRYDHLQRLSARSPANTEFTNNYYSMDYHSTMAQFTADNAHSWRLASVIPFLSDVVVLPKILNTHTWTRHKAKGHIWRPVMRSFQRAIAKCFRDSLIITGGTRYKEDTMGIVHKTTLLQSQGP